MNIGERIPESADVRFVIGFAVLFVMCFGSLGCGFFLIFAGAPLWQPIVIAVAVATSGRWLSPVVAWATMLGYRRRPPA
jgi:hypothetical protein